jgi:hypothetical protein
LSQFWIFAGLAHIQQLQSPLGSHSSNGNLG